MAKARYATDHLPVATSHELRMAALRRSSRRNAWVATRRLWWRWWVWGMGRALQWLSLPALGVFGLAWWAGILPLAGSPGRAPDSGPDRPVQVAARTDAAPHASPPPPAASAPVVPVGIDLSPVPPAASLDSTPDAVAPNASQPAGLRLRLDDEV